MTSSVPTDGPRIARTSRPEAEAVPEILALARAAGDADGANPLSEHVLLALRPSAAAPARHLTIRDATGPLVGYAHLEPAEDGTGAAAELVVHPAQRRRGLGRALVAAVIEEAAGAGRGAGRDEPAVRLRIWAHGDHPSAAAIGLDLGFDRARVLWQLRRSLADPLPEPRLPAGVSLRPFRPGTDDAAWLGVNARAFADHPEQGRWTAADLALRMSEPWFDPTGFLLAVEESTGRLLGFHWTKVHGPGGTGGAGEPIGEVYVLGVDPEAHRGGLGGALTVAGLRHLRERGLRRAMLYVDESNAAAMALYQRLGFGRWAADVNYQRAV